LEKSLEKFLEKIWIEDSTLFHRDNGKWNLFKGDSWIILK
jgi:hypothetical protein